MSHEIEIVNGQASMAYVGETPWHGLGVRLPDEVAPYQMMEAAGLDWSVEKQALVTAEGAAVTEKEALVRTSDNKVLDIVGKNWNPVQNEEAFNFFNDFCATGGMSMHTAGSLKGGQVVWALAKVNDSFELFGGDKVESYLLFSNPHKFGQAIDVRFTPIRVVCNNTLTLSLQSQSQSAVKLNHKTAFDPEYVKSMLGLANFKLGQYKEMAEALGKKKFKADNVNDYFDNLFPTLSKKERELSNVVQLHELSQPAQRCVELLETQPGANFAKGSWWSAFNAATYFIDHERGTNADNRLASAWYGQNKNLKLKALENAIEYAEAA
tara:strand:+ start:4892 stop:5863 length:972 start_codon:yes stop_codon:yes gene_type:complete